MQAAAAHLYLFGSRPFFCSPSRTGRSPSDFLDLLLCISSTAYDTVEVALKISTPRISTAYLRGRLDCIRIGTGVGWLPLLPLLG